MGLAETAKLAVQIDLGGNASAGLRGLERQVKGLGSSVGRVGKGFGQIGTGLFRAGAVLGAGAIAGLTGAAKAAIDFEDAFAGVKKTVDEAELKKAGLSFEALSAAFRKMATEMPISATEFARLGETAGALGVNVKDIEEFTRVTAMMGVTTNLTADEAADAFGRIGTILGLTGDDYRELADSIVAVGNAGASTESETTEITKRFAAQAKQAGLTKEEMVGLASATAAIGFGPERGGTALARVFANLSTDIATASGEGVALSKGLGRSLKSLQQDIDQGKGLGIFMDVLKELQGLSPTAAARFLKDIGVTNTSDRTIFQAMSDQLPVINEQLDIARKSQGALLEEARKKFATTASKIQTFKNNIIELGISLGEQLLPSVGRALDKLTAALKLPGTKAEVQQIGKDIGAAIDSIDWAKVLEGARQFKDVLRTALDFTMFILGALNKLPTELKAAALGFLALNKASGGLIGAGVGNIVGGLGETVVRGLASKIPKVGSLFAQPVFVTNWPMGGLGGLGGKGGAIGGLGAGAAAAAGGAGALGTAAALGAAAAAIAGVVITQQHFSNQSTDQATAIQAGLDASIAGKTLPELQAALDGVQTGIARIQSNPLLALVQGEALTTLQAMEADLKTAITNPTNALGGQSTQDLDPNTRQWRNDNPVRVEEIKEERETNARLKSLHDQANRTKDDLYSGLTDATAAALETKRETGRGASLISATTRTGDANIVSAIYGARPIISVNVSSTSITKVTTTSARYGKNTGSGGQNQVRPA